MDQGYGLSVSVKQLNTLAEDLERSIKRILTNPSFGAKAYRISSMMKAHRRSPVERVAGNEFTVASMLIPGRSSPACLHPMHLYSTAGRAAGQVFHTIFSSPA